MGSWSVYCGISRMSITSGDECVFLPLKKGYGEYLPYYPATLPIYGTYDDYGFGGILKTPQRNPGFRYKPNSYL